MTAGRLILIALVALSGCASNVPLQRAQIDAISRDTRPADLEQILAKATVAAQAEVQDSEQRYNARLFRLQTGTRQDMTMVCTPMCIPIMITVPVTSQYVVIQRLPQNELVAWGTPEELSKDTDPKLSALMPEIKQRLEHASKKP